MASAAPAGVGGGIRLIDPSYVPVGVKAEVLTQSAAEAGRVEARIRLRLTNFLHPLIGNHDGRGWDFGESVFVSDIATLIKDTPGVDAVQSLTLLVNATIYGDTVPVEPHQLMAAGSSQLKIMVPQVTYALA